MANHSDKGHGHGHAVSAGIPKTLKTPGPKIETIGPNTVSSSIAASRRKRPDVALLGAAPAFTDTLHVGRPNMPDRQAFLKRIDQVLDSGRLSNWGPLVQEFEDRVAEVSGAKYCIATCNATTGLELAISGLGMSGDVIVPSFTFIATVHALWLQGVRPVFCDIDPVTHCLDIDAVEAAITSRTTGILGVHLWGGSCADQRLRDLADRHNLKLLFPLTVLEEYTRIDNLVEHILHFARFFHHFFDIILRVDGIDLVHDGSASLSSIATFPHVSMRGFI